MGAGAAFGGGLAAPGEAGEAFGAGGLAPCCGPELAGAAETGADAALAGSIAGCDGSGPAGADATDVAGRDDGSEACPLAAAAFALTSAPARA